MGIDYALSLIDSELKRNGVVTRMPLGAELPARYLSDPDRRALQSPRALERARALHAVGQRIEAEAGWSAVSGTLAEAAGSPFPMHLGGHGYLLQRTTGVHGRIGPEAFTVGGSLTAGDDAAQVLADHLVSAWERVVDRDEHVVERLRGAEAHFGVRVLPMGYELQELLSCQALLVPGTRVCFTGEVVSPVHGFYGREEMERIARDRGLVISANMTKTRTDVLVVAQRGKPVLEAEEFLGWAL